MIQIHFQ